MNCLQLYIIFTILTFGSSPEAGSVVDDSEKMKELEVMIHCTIIAP